jgi:hypothetical protein
VSNPGPLAASPHLSGSSHAYLSGVQEKEVFVNATEIVAVTTQPYRRLMHAPPAIYTAKSVQAKDISTSPPHPHSQPFLNLFTPLIIPGWR